MSTIANQILTPQQETLILENSLERVLNTSIKLAKFLTCAKNLPAHIAELAWANEEDLRAIKETATEIWNNTRNEIFKTRMAQK